MKRLIVLLWGACLAVPVSAGLDFDQGRLGVRTLLADMGAAARALPDQAAAARPAAQTGPLVVNDRDQAWDLVKDNRIAPESDGRFASAVPPGITDWKQMSGWSQPETTPGTIRVPGRLGDAVSVDYLVVRAAGGRYQGRGRYLTWVAVVPSAVKVGRGAKLSMRVEVSGVGNAGTDEEPVAAMTVTLSWEVQAKGQTSRHRRVYYLQGDGRFEEVGAPADH